MKHLSVLLAATAAVLLSGCRFHHDSASGNDLVFDSLASTWDEGIPLGNGVIGALIWQKEDALRLSLDRVDLWDTRPAAGMDSLSTYNFAWIAQQVDKGDVWPVQMRYDMPYDTSACPSKIPGGAIEFNISGLGKAERVRLTLSDAVCEVDWDSGAKLHAFVHATEPVGWFRFDNVGSDFKPVLVPPMYQTASGREANALDGHDLQRLGYPQGIVSEDGNLITYRQQGSDGFYYDIAVIYYHKWNRVEGVWSISTSRSEAKDGAAAPAIAAAAVKRSMKDDFKTHLAWWKTYWAKSSISIPDKVIEKQYYNELYKFGSVARSYAPPISLQAVWTADNGQLPPWKGDFHHDLNTQLSYWPCYTANRLDEGLGYLNWLWEVRDTCKRYTREFFGCDGLAVPGVCTIDGMPMGGWCQYSMSPTVSAWLSQHFYLHWKYSADADFLRERAYPYVKDVAVFLDRLAVTDSAGMRRLPLSASPEIHDNSLRAWFRTNTNYDLALIRFVYTAAAEMAGELGLSEEERLWEVILQQWPALDVDEQGALTFAKGEPYAQSHRHFSHMMAFHPLGLVDWSNGEQDRRTIRATLDKLDKAGPDYWVGYSYSWLGNARARAMDGEGAAEALKIFAEHFCLRNTFHANGDQTKQGYSRFTYRPFTLEGNFAFASGVQEMLMQSHTGVIRVFPAVPASWNDASFENLRAMGGFLVSAQRSNGKVTGVKIRSEKGGLMRIEVPFTEGVKVEKNGRKTEMGEAVSEDGLLFLEMEAGEEIVLHT